MLTEVKGLHGWAIHATDGEIGKVDEILFDDKHWTVRYLIVDTGGRLTGRKVLISPMAFGLVDWEGHRVNINLTRNQVENSPGVETNQPVSRQWERDYFDYYSWPYYWNGIGGWGSYWYPGAMFAQPVDSAQMAEQKANRQALDHADAHLRSTKEVTDYSISATDGPIGKVSDFVVNSDTWRICYLAVDTQDWWPLQTKVMLPSDWIGDVTWSARSVTVNVTREQVRNAPEWDHSQPISRAFEDQLYGYYARQHPWERERPMFDMSERRENTTNPATHAVTSEQAGPPAKSAVVAIYDTHRDAETAIRDLQKMGFDMTRLSIVGKDYHTNEEVVGYYTAGDRMKTWGTTGAVWGGIWSLLFGSAFFIIPGVGPLLAAGPIVGWIVGAVEGAAVVGGVSALGAALFSLGIEKDSVISYETQIKAGKFVVIAHDIRNEQDRAMIALEAGKHRGAGQPAREAAAAK